MHNRVPYLAAPELNIKQYHTLQWYPMQCELVTPLYGGGVKEQTVDIAMPVRVSAIRGQLRFWWRLLAKHKWKLDESEDIRRAEFTLWGGMSDESAGHASQVLLRVKPPEIDSRGLINGYNLIKMNKYKGLSYALWSLQRNEGKSIDLLKAGTLQFQLDIAFLPGLQCNKIDRDRVIETLQWWANFGGLGARTRRGLGAVHVTGCDAFPDICQSLDPAAVEKAGCRLKISDGKSVDALEQLQQGIQKLAHFRQKIGVGRSGKALKAGRSFWPEADALRRIIGKYSQNHQPEHKADKVFPRAMFGLPIVFNFPKERSLNTTLVPKKEKNDRLASPLIIRPYYKGTRNGQKLWSVAALVMPYGHIKKMSVSIDNGKSYSVWKSDTAQYIKPIRDNQGTDPLTAFLNYF